MRAVRRTVSNGQTLAEFALVLPVFLLIVLGLFDVGRYVFVTSAMTNAAREGARLAIVNQDVNTVWQRAQAMAFGVTIDTVPANIVRYYQPGPDRADVEQNDECDNSDSTHELVVGCVAVVRAEATWQPITPIIGNILGPQPVGASSALPVELVCPSPSFVTCPREQ